MRKEILNEIENILAQEKCKESDCISLYDIYKVIGQRCNDYNNLRTWYERKIGSKMEGFGDVWSVFLSYHIKNFDFENMEMKIDFAYGRFYDYATFTKIGNDLFLTSSNGSEMGKKLLNKCNKKISECYDECLKYKDVFTQKSKSIQSINSNFKIDISGEEISLSKINKEDCRSNLFKLTINTLNNECHYKCEINKSDLVSLTSVFTNKDVEILKSIFIKIEDCPSWTQTLLFEIREKQLEEKSKQVKSLNLTRKLFPLLKK